MIQLVIKKKSLLPINAINGNSIFESCTNTIKRRRNGIIQILWNLECKMLTPCQDRNHFSICNTCP